MIKLSDNMKTNLFLFVCFFILAAIFLTQDVKFYKLDLSRIFTGICFVFGFYMIGKLFWMCYYEKKYYEGAGEDYFKFGKKFVIDTYNELLNEEEIEDLEEKIKEKIE